MPRLRALNAAIVAAAAATAPFVPSQSAAQQHRQTFTDSQAVRGGQWFAATCQACHPVRDMSSPDFKVRWSGQTAFDLYRIISTTMPQAEPGSLSRRAYTDIVAYLMQINGIPAGPTPLAPDSVALSTARLAFDAHANATRR